MRKCVFGMSDQVRFKPASSASETRFIIEILEWVSCSQGSEQKDADQTARMRRLICAFIVRICHLADFRMTWLKCKTLSMLISIEHNICFGRKLTWGFANNKAQIILCYSLIQ